MRRWRRWATAAVVTAFAAAIFLQRSVLADAVQQTRSLSLPWIGSLAAVYVLSIVAQAAYGRAVTPGLSLARAATVQHVTMAANNTIVGSGPVNLGLRVAMMRSWDISDRSIGVTVVVLNVISSYAIWVVALATALVGASGAGGAVVDHRVYFVIIAVSVLLLAVSTLLWWILLTRPRLAGWLARHAQRLVMRAQRRFPRIPNIDLGAIVERLRDDARHLARRHGIRIAVTAVIDQLVTLAKPVLVVRAFGIGPGTVSTAEIIVAYGLVRLAGALLPLPGGIGVTEIGMAALLTRFGGPEASVVGAVMTYRAMTYVIPILTGGLWFGIWQMRRSRPARDDDIAPWPALVPLPAPPQGIGDHVPVDDGDSLEPVALAQTA